MRILVAALTCPKGDIQGNRDRHLEVVARAAQSACDPVVFPGMSLTGYRAGAAIGLQDPAVKTLISATDDEDLPGWAAVIDPSGRPVAETADGREGLLALDVPLPDPRRRKV